MADSQKKIILITTGQPSTNPRLWKEYTALTDAGYHVKVVYAYRNEWAMQQDKKLMHGRKQDFILAGGAPTKHRIIYFWSRVLHKLLKIFPLNKPYSVCDRSSYFLRKAIRFKADLYIAHTVGALPAAARASLKHSAVYGFDAEDFHRMELSNNESSESFIAARAIEDRWIPGATYLTAASPLIADEYKKLYHRPVTSILNVFPPTPLPPVSVATGRLKLFWFSQTVGRGRGLEEVLHGISLSGSSGFELHLLGSVNRQTKEWIKDFCKDLAIDHKLVTYHDPIPPDDIPGFSSRFDIGLCCETGTPYNREICLTNKLFSYIQAGLALIASNTLAQESFLNKHPQSGLIYQKNNPGSLAACFNTYLENTALLQNHKQNNRKLAEQEYNWTIEKTKFLELIGKHLA